MTGASGGECSGQGPSTVNVRIQASSDVQRGRAPRLHHALLGVPRLPPPPPLGSVESARRARSLRCRCSVPPPAPPPPLRLPGSPRGGRVTSPLPRPGHGGRPTQMGWGRSGSGQEEGHGLPRVRGRVGAKVEKSVPAVAGTI
ncbi:uncharacterized protein LOC144365438 isoform X2 [Ictidomys tridecemlineatus]